MSYFQMIQHSEHVFIVIKKMGQNVNWCIYGYKDAHYNFLTLKFSLPPIPPKWEKKEERGPG